MRFTYRDRKRGDRRKVALLTAEEFIGRFLKHVLPERFQRIRHYGLLANRGKRARLNHCRKLLGAKPTIETQQQPQSPAEWLKSVLGIDPDRCPCCGDLLVRETLEPQPPPIGVAGSHSQGPWDTS